MPPAVHSRRRLHACGLIAAALMAGCGRGPSLYPVEGIVLLDGVPVEGASVSFSPAGPGSLPASAQTKVGGTFRLGTWLPAAAKVGMGAAPGDYVVIIEKVDAPPPETFAPDDPRYGRPAPPAPKITYIVPQLYSDRVMTPLKAAVQKGPNAFTFELDSKKVPKDSPVNGASVTMPAGISELVGAGGGLVRLVPRFPAPNQRLRERLPSPLGWRVSRLGADRLPGRPSGALV